MNTLTFQADGIFEMRLQTPPTATTEDGIVIVTLPVFAAGFPQATAEMEMLLTIPQAEHLWSQLQPALAMAQERQR